MNNAGVCRVVAFEQMTSQDFRHSIDVNLMGTVHTCRAAWPHMKARGHGRIVNVTSGSMAGFAWQSAYAAAKAGVFSFTRVLAAEGVEHGIRANTIAPVALTRMVFAAQAGTSPFVEQTRGNLLPEAVAPAVVSLAHESCPLSGECLESMGGQLRRLYLVRTPGLSAPGMSVETVAERWPGAMAGTDEGVFRHDDRDPREWHVKPYVPLD